MVNKHERKIERARRKRRMRSRTGALRDDSMGSYWMTALRVIPACFWPESQSLFKRKRARSHADPPNRSPKLLLFRICV